MMPSGGRPASVTPRCSGTSGRASAKRRLTSITFAGSRIFERDAVAREAEFVEQSAMLKALSSIGAIESSSSYFACWPDRRCRSSRRRGWHSRCRRRRRRGSGPFPARACPFVVIEVPGVVADLVDVRRDRLGQPVVLLQIDREIGLRLPADFGSASASFRCRRRCARHRPRPRAGAFDLRDGGVNVLRDAWPSCSARRSDARRRWWTEPMRTAAGWIASNGHRLKQ